MYYVVLDLDIYGIGEWLEVGPLFPLSPVRVFQLVLVKLGLLVDYVDSAMSADLGQSLEATQGSWK